MSILKNMFLNCTLPLPVGPNQICLQFAEFNYFFTALPFLPLHHTKTEQIILKSGWYSDLFGEPGYTHSLDAQHQAACRLNSHGSKPRILSEGCTPTFMLYRKHSELLTFI